MAAAEKGSAKVIAVDLLEPPGEIEIEIEARYRRACVVVRVGPEVIGQFYLSGRRGLAGSELWRVLPPDIALEGWRAMLRRRLREALAIDAGGADPAVSVIVCTRDRPDDLRACLASIGRLSSPPAEVLVVDNGSGSAETRQVCEEAGVDVVHEPLPGQTRARNRGIRETSGDLVAFTDDDVAVEPGWLDDLAEPFADPLVMCVTGPIGPAELETESQYLFERHGGFERHPERRTFDLRQGPPLDSAAIAGAGANMIIRRRAFDHVGGFAEELGPGTPARSSDDKYFFYSLLEAGFRLIYEPGRPVWHRHRRDSAALDRIMRDYGTAEFAYTTLCATRHRDPAAARIWRWWARHCLTEARASLRSDSKIPIRLPWQEARGALSGPAAMLRASRSRRGIEPLAVDGGTGSSPAPAPRVEAERAPLSIAVASRNRRSRLQGLLKALAAQSAGPEAFEVVVVLDGSTDGSAEMLESADVPFSLRVVPQEPSGLAIARNRGAAEAEFPLVCFLDDDIYPEPGFAAAHIEAHAGGSEQVVLGSYPPADASAKTLWGKHQRIWWHDHFRRKARPDHRWTFTDMLDGNCSIPTALFERMDGFFEGFSGGRRQDWDFGFRALSAGVTLTFESQALGLHHFDPTFAGAVRNSRDEGRQDVLLVSRHPSLAENLPLAAIGRELDEGSRRLRVLMPLLDSPAGIDRAAAGVAALERGRAHRRWRYATDRILIAAYALGLCDALPSQTAREEFLATLGPARDAPVVPLDLDASGQLDLPPDGAADIAVRVGGVDLATVPAIRPGGQWDAEDLAERAAANSFSGSVRLSMERIGAET